MQLDLRDKNPVERNLHGIHAGLIQRKIDHGDDWEVHLESRIGARRDIQLAIRRP